MPFDISTAKSVTKEEIGKNSSKFDLSTAKPAFEDTLDRSRGAPASIRSAAASAPTDQDRLSFLKKYYPDIQSYKEDNYVFTDPETKRPTLYNPEGLDLGDVAEFGRGTAELLGGGIGAAVATVGGQLGPQIATPEEIVTVPAAAGAGAALAGNIYDTLTRSIFDVPDTRSALASVGDEGISVMANAIGQRAGDIASELLSTGVKSVGRYIGKTADEIKDAFTRIETSPTAGAISQNKTIQGVENALAKLPLSSDIIGKQYQATVDGMDKFATKLASNLSKKEGTEEIGRSIKKGVNKFTDKFKVQASDLYNNLWNKLPTDSRVPITNFTNELDDIVGQFSDDPAFRGLLDSPIITKLKDASYKMLPIGVTVKTLKALRTKIGNELDNKSLLTDTTNAELKKLYGALSEDMKSAAENAGALNQFTRANNYWKAGRSRIDEVLNPIVSIGDAEKIYSKVFGKEGQVLKNVGGSTIRKLMRSLPKASQKDVSSEFIRRMGTKSPGSAGFEDIGTSFSPARYITQYNKMPNEAKKAVFDRVPGLRQATDDLARTSAAVKEGFSMANNSGTAGQLMFMSLLTGGIGGAYGGSEGAAVGIGALLAPAAAAKLMTNPKFVRWLADAGKISISDPNSIGPFMGRLYAIAEGEPLVQEYVESLNNAFRPAVSQE